MGCQDAVVTAVLLSPEKDKAGHLQCRQKAERVAVKAGRKDGCLRNVISSSSSNRPVVSSCTFIFKNSWFVTKGTF